MNKYLFLLLSIIVLQCSNSLNSNSTEPFLAQPSLDKLALDSLPAFWGSDTGHRTSGGVDFPSQGGYIDDRIFWAAGSRCLGVTIFTSKSAAIAAMEYRINNVACVIQKGGSTDGKTWWYSLGAGCNALFLSKYNTIIEAIRNGSTLLSVQDTLWGAVNEIEKRVDALVVREFTYYQ